MEKRVIDEIRRRLDLPAEIKDREIVRRCGNSYFAAKIQLNFAIKDLADEILLIIKTIRKNF